MGSSTTNATATGNIIVGGSATATASTPYSNNYAIQLDGANDYAPVVGSLSAGTYDFLTSTLTYSASIWFKLDNYLANAAQVLLANNYTGTYKGIQIWYDNRSSQGATKSIKVHSWSGSAVNINVQNAISDNDWHHIVVTSSGANGTLSIYLDGNTTPIGTTSLGSVSSTAPQQDLAIGGRVISSAVQGSVGGLLDEVAVWDVTLSSSDVSSIYNSGEPNDLTDSSSYNTDRSTDLQGYWRFEDNTVNGSTGTVIDHSGQGNSASLKNGIQFSSSVPVGSSTAVVAATGNIIVGGSATATLGTGVSGTATGNIVIGGSATGTATSSSFSNNYSIQLDGSDDYIEL